MQTFINLYFLFKITKTKLKLLIHTNRIQNIFTSNYVVIGRADYLVLYSLCNVSLSNRYSSTTSDRNPSTSHSWRHSPASSRWGNTPTTAASWRYSSATGNSPCARNPATSGGNTQTWYFRRPDEQGT